MSHEKSADDSAGPQLAPAASAVEQNVDSARVRSLEQQIIRSERLATLGQLAAGVAHELNNPLTAISVYASYLHKKLEGQIEERDLVRLERIVQAAERIQYFTKDLVAYGKPSEEAPQKVDLESLFERALSFCEHVIADAQAEVELNIADNIGEVFGIAGQLEQVFVNLLTNACHALPSDGGRIVIAAQRLSAGRLRVELSDTGCGIPENNLTAVFEPFFTTKKEGQGTGLGLSIVRNILDHHDATIEASSTEGAGTTFTIEMYVKD